MITDLFLNEVAKALNNESYVVCNYITYGTDILSALSSDTSLSGETGTRSLVTRARTANVINHNHLKTGSIITNPTGIELQSLALFDALTVGTLLTEAPIAPSIIQTTTFDIEIDWGITINRV